ncbi:MAG: hypothetical protein KatS3mg077_1219 [Candidatus Binatia bacterium]|nr:MAG: hypothetical protein KatS3mg077_1219 [Candidatus Binatia bacterium]
MDLYQRAGEGSTRYHARGMITGACGRERFRSDARREVPGPTQKGVRNDRRSQACEGLQGVAVTARLVRGIVASRIARGCAFLLGGFIALCWLRAAEAQVVVSSNGQWLFITRIGQGVQQIDVGGEVVAVAASATHAYALARGGTEVVQVGLADGQVQERIPVPCCGRALAVTADEGLLAVGGSDAGGQGRVHLFARRSGTERSFPVESQPEQILAEGCQFLIVSPAPRPPGFFFFSHATQFSFAIVGWEGKRLERWIPGFFKGFVPGKEVVLSLDAFNEEIVLTRLAEMGSHRIRFVDEKTRAYRGPDDVVAGTTRAYAVVSTGGKAGFVDLATGELTIFPKFRFPCCDYVLALSADERLLFIGLSDLNLGRVGAVALDTFQDVPGAGARVKGQPQYLFVDGERLVVLSRYTEERSWYPNFFITTAEIGGNDLVYEVPQFEPRRYWVTGPGLHRDIGPVAFVPRHQRSAPIRCEAEALPRDGDDSSGCHVSGGLGVPWLGVAFGLLALLLRRRKISLLAAATIFCLPTPSFAKVIADGATLRIDLEENTSRLPQPNGPATARPLPPGQSLGFASMENDQVGEPDSVAPSTVTDVTFEVEVAVDIERDWRGWFNDDIQLLVNYVAGSFEVLNGVLLRDAGVKLTIVHMHVWRNRDRRDPTDPDIQPPWDPTIPSAVELNNFLDFWNLNWPRCESPGQPPGCVPRDALVVLRFDGGNGGHGTRGGYVQNEPLRLGDLGSLERSFSRRPLSNERG